VYTTTNLTKEPILGAIIKIYDGEGKSHKSSFILDAVTQLERNGGRNYTNHNYYYCFPSLFFVSFFMGAFNILVRNLVGQICSKDHVQLRLSVVQLPTLQPD
jgi:hypothetical protein